MPQSQTALDCAHDGYNGDTSPSGLGASLGYRLPVNLPHAISVSLPTWEDNLDYVNGKPRVLSKMKSGYPRFKVHYLIEQLEDVFKTWLGSAEEKCHLFPSLKYAEACRAYLEICAPTSPPSRLRVVRHTINIPSQRNGFISTQEPGAPAHIQLYIVFFPVDLARLAKSFWQHTGTGISSRMAEYCLAILSHDTEDPQTHGVRKTTLNTSHPTSPLTPDLRNMREVPICTDSDADNTNALNKTATLLHELPLAKAAEAKRILRQRIADLVVEDPSMEKSARIAQRVVSEDDVVLFPTGMAAIWHTHLALVKCFPGSKSVSFGFPYADTLKVLEKWGPGAHLFAVGDEHEVHELVGLLQTSRDAGTPIRALWCEFPSNPLLRSPPLARLRELADEYNFLIAIDDTIGTFDNVDVLPLVDLILTSLSKVFSGTANVLGGSLILNPKSKHYEAVRASVAADYEDHYWSEDVVQMELNSRDVTARVRKMNESAEAIVDFLRSRAISAQHKDGKENLVIKEVYYPKWITRDQYDMCRRGSPQHMARSGKVASSSREGGYSMLFSIAFISDFASVAFYDALDVAKGPSLGTNFTLACPYTILGHPFELGWAATHGVEQGLVRVSVGLEDTDMLLSLFKEALAKAENAVQVTHRK